ncbi:coiled-coil domain-containing protein [Actinocorallia populi]|uniref:molecular chaperone DnaJ n=1 Tax=Actinocorallia populi TaxID=2079200 RepID=UPI000D0960C9|nr:molecular chaperone DnaJ [Actinocorallia populi]
MYRSGDSRRRGRGDQRAAESRAAALAAKAEAAQAFYEMDQAQKHLAGRLSLLEDLDRGAAGRLRPRAGRADAGANTAALDYITAVDSHDLDSEDRSSADYAVARAALAAATAALKRSASELDGATAAVDSELARLEGGLERLAPRLRAAREAFQTAQEAVSAAEGAGMRTEEVAADLAALQALLAELTAPGLGGLGLQGATARAEEVAARASALAEEARNLAVAVQKTRNDLASVRTRVQMAAGRRERVDEAMSVLRRRYSAACWQDLQGAPNAISQALERALERIAETERAAAGQEWRDVARSLAAARTELKDAERRARAVTGRVEELAEAERDPDRPLEQARFTVRDAQRLAVAAPGGPDPRHARALDALAERLERAPGLLQGPHPDYWGYLRELRAISTGARDVVEIIREERSR